MRISIITVCLNSERTIEQTIQSVVGQQYGNLEYIVVDGGSTDKTLEIVGKYAENIAIVTSELDDGIYDAMNKGIALSTGDVIGIINSDDWYEPDTFETMHKCFLESDAEVVYGGLNLVNEDGVMQTQIPSNIEKLRYEMEIPHPTVFVRREIYQKYGVFQLKYKTAADFELMLRLYTKGAKFVCLDRVIANFRHGGISEQQGMNCAEETSMIAHSYLPCTPLDKRGYVKNIISHRAKALHFDRLLDDSSHSIWDILHGKLGVSVEDDIVIFGAGKWGTKVYNALLQEGVRPLFLVDNNKKQGETEDGIKIVSPEELKSYRGVLLVLVRDFVPEILLQVEAMCNRDIYCITWEEITTSFMMTI